jgi:hypothetical protein
MAIANVELWHSVVVLAVLAGAALGHAAFALRSRAQAPHP